MKMDTITVTALIKMTHKATAANTFKRLESLTRWIYYNSCYSSYPKLMDNTKQSNWRRATMMMCEDVSQALLETNGSRRAAATKHTAENYLGVRLNYSRLPSWKID